MLTTTSSKGFYNTHYASDGFNAQRRYPSEEFLRFLGRHYFHLPPSRRRDIRALELGCGSGANLWALAREGFDSHGIDISAEGLKLCEQMLASWGTQATLKEADMTVLPYENGAFDMVMDVFSSYCLDEARFNLMLDEVIRVLTKGGRFFSYAPSKGSDAFKNHEPARKIDASTLDGIQRKTSPYYGNNYAFRFVAPQEYADALTHRGLTVTYNETVERSYRSGAEIFQFVVIVAEKSSP